MYEEIVLEVCELSEKQQREIFESEEIEKNFNIELWEFLMDCRRKEREIADYEDDNYYSDFYEEYENEE